MEALQFRKEMRTLIPLRKRAKVLDPKDLPEVARLTRERPQSFSFT